MSAMPDDGDKPPAGGPATPELPTCYRHTGRETYIRCARCDRYICPDCMTAAPVGFHCPECVREGGKTVRRPTTPVGGEIREHGDVVTKTLIVVNLAVFLLGFLVGQNTLAGRFSLLREGLFQGQIVGVLHGEWYRMLTAAFVHLDIWHIGLNMFALWILGSNIEPILGRWRFVALYVLSALGGSAASLLATGFQSYGASGAVFGLFGALFVMARRFGGNVSAVVAILGINLVLGFVIPRIDWRAHVGGLVVGAAVAFVFAHAPRRLRTVSAVIACAVALAVVLAVVTIFVAR